MIPTTGGITNLRAGDGLTAWRHGRVTTMHDDEGWDPHDDWSVVTRGDTIVWIGAEGKMPADLRRSIQLEHDLAGRLLTPGLIDCHTHLVYGGKRDAEFERRLSGVSYEEIARAGGGIRSTVAATRRASQAELLSSACQRARRLQNVGVTTVEIKSGYGLDFETETRCLEVARDVGQECDLSVRTTCLAAHTVPVEFDGAGDAYIDEVCRWIPRWSSDRLMDAVDVFCDTVGFSLEQTRRVFECAARQGLRIKCHAEQLSLQGGAALAASFNALSCDHLEYLDDAGIAAMRNSGTVAVLLPGAYYTLQQSTPPPVAKLRQAGVPLAIATDHNPGSSPLLSLPLAGSMACTLFGLTPYEAVRGMTRSAARALGLEDRGCLAAGKRAHFAIWEYDHFREVVYWL
ncbi:MAG: imidazolonepropionase [Planctomycetaceae bacterium]|nr:imidazolonepropionase [Planctomycetaceae bacterium]